MNRIDKIPVLATCSRWLAIALLGGVAFYAGLNVVPACAADRFWDSGAGADQNWATVLNWNTDTLPTNVDRAYINNGGTGQVISAQSIGAFTLGHAAADSGTLIIGPGGSLSDVVSGAYSYVGRNGTGSFYISGGSYSRTGNHLRIGEESGSSGTVYHTGGSLSARGMVLARQAGSTGRYELSGATSSVNINVDSLWVGFAGDGTFVHTAGSLSAPGIVLGNDDGSSGTYTLSGASSTVHSSSSLWVGYGGTGKFTQSAGTVTVASQLRIGDLGTGDGTYELSGGTVSVTGQTRIGEANGAKGKVVQTGGSLGTVGMVIARVAGSTGRYELSGAASVVNVNTGGHFYVGHQGAGTFVQTDGAVNVADHAYVGYDNGGNGLYQMSGGALNVTGDLRLRENAGSTGKFELSGGTVSANNLVMARTGSGAGTAEFSVSGTGQLTTASHAYIAYSGPGVFNQTGGTVKIGGNLILTNASTATGTYNLQGGVLDMDGGNITRHPSAVSNFNFTGGRLEDVNTFNGNLLQQGGTLAAGNSPGIMNITGDYTLGTAATLEVEIFGDNPLTPDFDQYIVGGNAVLNGTLNLLGNDSFETDLDVFENMFFDVLTADSITVGPTFNLDQSSFAFGNGLYELFNFEVVDIGGGQQALRLSLLAVPEPASLLLWAMGGGLALAAAVYRQGLRKSRTDVKYRPENSRVPG